MNKLDEDRQQKQPK